MSEIEERKDKEKEAGKRHQSGITTKCLFLNIWKNCAGM